MNIQKRGTLNPGYTYYYSLPKLVSSRLLSEPPNIRVYKTILSLILDLLDVVSYIEEEHKSQASEKTLGNIRSYERRRGCGT
jgi:hypothetical protein